MQPVPVLHRCSQGAAAERPCSRAPCNPAVGTSEVGDVWFEVQCRWVGVRAEQSACCAGLRRLKADGEAQTMCGLQGRTRACRMTWSCADGLKNGLLWIGS